MPKCHSCAKFHTDRCPSERREDIAVGFYRQSEDDPPLVELPWGTCWEPLEPESTYTAITVFGVKMKIPRRPGRKERF